MCVCVCVCVRLNRIHEKTLSPSLHVSPSPSPSQPNPQLDRSHIEFLSLYKTSPVQSNDRGTPQVNINKYNNKINNSFLPSFLPTCIDYSNFQISFSSIFDQVIRHTPTLCLSLSVLNNTNDSSSPQSPIPNHSINSSIIHHPSPHPSPNPHLFPTATTTNSSLSLSLSNRLLS